MNVLLDWHDINLKPKVLAIIAQQSGRVFLGENFCRDPAWLKLTMEITGLAFGAVRALRVWPSPLRPFAAWFLPACRTLRSEIARARDIVNPIVGKRREVKENCLKVGQAPPTYHDTIEWAEQCVEGQTYDPAVMQLTIALSAMHNSSDFLTQLIFDICSRPGLIAALRQEIIQVKQQYSWHKATVYHLKLMDSVMKESQRLKPTGLGKNYPSPSSGHGTLSHTSPMTSEYASIRRSNSHAIRRDDHSKRRSSYGRVRQPLESRYLS